LQQQTVYSQGQVGYQYKQPFRYQLTHIVPRIVNFRKKCEFRSWPRYEMPAATAITCSYFGVWRLSTITVYWAIAAFITVPISRNLHIQVDTSLVILGVAGLMLSTFLYINYERTKPVG